MLLPLSCFITYLFLLLDSVSKKSGIAKAIGSGGGAIGGGLTLVGGILTIASMGAALPVLLAGTSIGLASGIGGGAAAVTEKIIKSRQLKQAQESIDADKEATCHLEEDISKLRSNKKVVNKIAKDVIVSGGSAAYDSVQIFNLVAGKAGAANTLKAGIEATAQLLGEDVGKEVSMMVIPIRDLLHIKQKPSLQFTLKLFSSCTFIGLKDFTTYVW